MIFAILVACIAVASSAPSTMMGMTKYDGYDPVSKYDDMSMGMEHAMEMKNKWTGMHEKLHDMMTGDMDTRGGKDSTRMGSGKYELFIIYRSE